MPELFQASTWSFELPDGWMADSREDHVRVRLPFDGATLRITPYHDDSGQLSAAAWLGVVEHFTRKRGRLVIPQQCGDFAGHETRFDAGGIWIRGWALLANGQGLDVDYRCALADAGRDDHAVDAVLATLRLRSAA